MTGGVSWRASAARRLPPISVTRLDVAQANCSVSRRGVIRGVHFADVHPGQAKYLSCVHGTIIDVVVDLRVGSPGFGAWEAGRR